MGQYLKATRKGPMPQTGKREALIEDGAESIEKPAGPSPTLVVVVKNAGFDAALVCDNQHDYDRVIRAEPEDWRAPYAWLNYPALGEAVKE